MKLGWGQGCLIIAVLLAIVASFQFASQSVGGIVLMVLLAAGLIAFVFLAKKYRSNDMHKLLLQQADTLDQYAAGTLKIDDSGPALKKDEVVVYRLNRIVLKEFKSTGSTFSGGYGGVSFGVTKGIRANVGGMQGSSTRNPEESTPLDAGLTIFTNQRIIFVGDNLVREWDLDKLLNISADDNGINLSLAVSNRDKASILSGANFPDLTPGMAASIATAWHDEGKEAALASAKDMADRLRKAVADEEASKS